MNREVPRPVTATPMANCQVGAGAIAIFDIDGVVRDVAGSYLRALADTVEHFTAGVYRPTLVEVDLLKSEGIWNNDWEASQELVYRFYEAQGQPRSTIKLDYQMLVNFFQARYRGTDFSGYIRDEPLLLSSAYLMSLTQAGVLWGFFSGATRGSATYVLEKRLGLSSPVLVAMEDAPGKPDPQGLLEAVRQLCELNNQCWRDREQIQTNLPVLYVGDTVADLQTVERARTLYPAMTWIGVGVLPPHVQEQTTYTTQLQEAGATVVLTNVEHLTPKRIQELLT